MAQSFNIHSNFFVIVSVLDFNKKIHLQARVARANKKEYNALSKTSSLIMGSERAMNINWGRMSDHLFLYTKNGPYTLKIIDMIEEEAFELKHTILLFRWASNKYSRLFSVAAAGG